MATSDWVIRRLALADNYILDIESDRSQGQGQGFGASGKLA